jgi:diguanylate cyclase (GGDEF)-like protein
MHEFHQVFTNGMMLTVNIGLFAFFILSVIKILANWKNVRLPFHLAFILICVFLWSAVSVLRFTIEDRAAIFYLSLLPSVFFSLSLMAMVFFAMRFHNLKAFIRMDLITLFLIFPAMTVTNIIISHLNLSTPSSPLHLIRQYPVVSTGNLFYVHGYFGQWHNFVTYAGYCVIFVLVVSVIMQHVQLPKIYRAPSEKLMSGTIIVAISVVAAILNSLGGREGIPIDFVLIGFIFSARFFYAATLSTQGLVFLSQARNDVIQNIRQCILFLDEESNIIFKNNAASECLSGMPIASESFSDMINYLGSTAATYEKLSDEDGGCDYHFEAGGRKTVFNLRQKPITDKKNRQIGMYVVYSDVTENRELIRRLEVGAGRDVLTGLNNRAMMESLKRELDTLDNLPLSVIIADLNDLKKTNDIHGHQAGDIMLRVCGEALSERCPPTAQTGRIGGDEFLILLPKTAKMESEEIMEEIRAHLKKIDDYPYKIVMAMGCSVKGAADEDLGRVMEDADKAMYADKRKIKGGEGIRSTETRLI